MYIVLSMFFTVKPYQNKAKSYELGTIIISIL